jgi:hypothetical protein
VIYCIGFERGLNLWRRLLAPRGVVVVSELTCLSAEAPTEAERFWEHNYPAMTDIAAYSKRISEASYDLLDTYRLPTAAWWQNYYDPLELQLNELSQKYAGVEATITYLDAQREEIELFRRFSDSYGYVFYIASPC